MTALSSVATDADATVFVTGGYGRGHAGADAGLATVLGSLSGYRPIVASENPASTENQFGCDVIDATDPACVRANARAAGALVVTGGVAMGSQPGEFKRMGHLLALALRARLARKPVALMGIGVGQLHTWRSRALANTLIRTSDLVVLRDDQSAEALTLAGIPTPFRVGTDLSWTLAPGGQLKQPEQAGREDQVVVSLDRASRSPRLQADLANALLPLAGDGMRVLLQPWRSGRGAGDEQLVARRIMSRMGTKNVEIVDSPSSLQQAKELFANSRLVVALRSHAVIAAACAGVGILALSADPTTVAMAANLGVPSLQSARNPAAVRRSIVSALDIGPPEHSEVDNEVGRSFASLRLLELLLSRGSAIDPVDIDPLPLYPELWRT